MLHRLASSKALGFGVLAIALWMVSIPHSGLVSPTGIDPGTAHMVLMIAALGLLIAGIVAFLRHEGWLAFFFLLWSGLTWGGMHAMGSNGGMAGSSALYAAWFTIAITFVNLYLWLTAWAARRILGEAVSFTLLLIWVSWLLIALGEFLNGWVLIRAGAAVGLASALAAFYVSAGTVACESCPDMRLFGIPEADLDDRDESPRRPPPGGGIPPRSYTPPDVPSPGLGTAPRPGDPLGSSIPPRADTPPPVAGTPPISDTPPGATPTSPDLDRPPDHIP
jgi:succinate-acetate transporter protein